MGSEMCIRDRSMAIQRPVIEKMVRMDAIRRLAFMGEGSEPVG